MKRIHTIAFLILICSCVSKPQGESGIKGSSHVYVMPLVAGENSLIQHIELDLPAGSEPIQMRYIRFTISQEAKEQLESVSIHDQGQAEGFNVNARMFTQRVRPGSSNVEVPVRIRMQPGKNYLWVSAKLKENAPPDGTLAVLVRDMVDQTDKSYRLTNVGHEGDPFWKRKAMVLREAGQKAHTYRIPGLITTKKGTLIAVYDVRYENSSDLPGNIDVGMSRSEDGGRSWEPMRIIMDMGKPQDGNGIGDPCILYDPAADKIIVAALWSKGDRSIRGSGPGLKPEETGQFMTVESTDDGRNWTMPRSITPMVKDPAWRIFFQAPGVGIVMKDGTLVMPAQYWDASGLPHSTIVFSKDHGATWKRGTGAAPNTTECQVVETQPGVLMLNMRDNRGGYRTVATTRDLGKTWEPHPTSGRALPDPVCMAGLLRAEVLVSGQMKDVLFFSNPMSGRERVNLGIRVSRDLGETWSEGQLIDERKSYGYSVLTRIDANTIGLLYEGTGSLYFMRIPVKELIR
jgi:sialidase-1